MLAPWKKSYEQPRQYIKKQRHYFANKSPSSQSYGFSSSHYGCESWTIKKAEHGRIDAFELWCCRRLLRVPWTARTSNKSIPKEISPEYSLEGLRLKLKLQYFGHMMWRTDSLQKTLMLGKIEGRKRRGWQRMVGWHDRPDRHEFEQALGVAAGQGGLACGSPWGCRVRHDWATELNWIGSSGARKPPVNAGDAGLIPGLGRSSEEGNGNPGKSQRERSLVDYSPWSHK